MMSRACIALASSLTALALLPLAAGAQQPDGTRPVQQVVGSGAPSVPGLVRLSAIVDDGGYVQLADSTTWTVYLPDRPQVAAWRADDLILARLSPVSHDRYDYLLVNATNGTQALARLGGPPR